MRWFCDWSRLRQLATDNMISKSTAYAYLDEDIEVIAAQTPPCLGRPMRPVAVSADRDAPAPPRCGVPGRVGLNGHDPVTFDAARSGTAPSADHDRGAGDRVAPAG